MKRLACGALVSAVILAPCSFAGQSSTRMAQGFVFEDKNGDGQRSPGEPGLPRALVSNGREVVRTDRDGRWKLPHDDDTIFFVIKPTGYAPRLDSWSRPTGWHYVHRPAGSPKVKFGGIPPTGPLPSSIDFGLMKSQEPRKFKVAFFGDTQPYTIEQVQYTAQDAISEVAGRRDIAFGISLGDVVGDNLSLLPPLLQAKATMGVPWRYVVGNHDIDFDVPGDQDSTSTWTHVVGPPYYAFEHGGVWFIILENINFRGTGKGYDSALNEEQLAWLTNLLKEVPKDRMTVLSQHIPIDQLKERAELFRLLSGRPNTLSLAAHEHINRHIFFGEKEGWTGSKPHHHLVAATVCGSWWNGELDEVGIPHSTMRDGAPRGYIIAEFTPSSYDLSFKATRRPAEYQMNIDAPQRVKVNENFWVHANFFFGTPFCRLEMRIGQGDWSAMTLQPPMRDPFYSRIKAFEEAKKTPATGTKLPGYYDSPHIWRGGSNRPLSPGAHLIEVKATDYFGRVHHGRRVIWVD